MWVVTGSKEFPMQRFQTLKTSQIGETVSNLFHGAVAIAFGLVTLAAAAHVALTLA
jgi:hypothetical protein